MFEPKIKWKGDTLYYIADTSTIIELLKIEYEYDTYYCISHSNIYQSGISIIFYNIKCDRREEIVKKIEDRLLNFAKLTLKSFENDDINIQ